MTKIEDRMTKEENRETKLRRAGSLITIFVILFSLFAFVPSAHAVSNSGLVGYWSLNEGAGTVATDFSGNGNAGAISGGTWTSGKRGGAVELSSSGAITVANSSSINLGTTETIAFWVKGTPTAPFAGMVEKINFGVTGFAIVNADSSGNNDLYVRIDTSGGASQNCTAVPGITDVLDGTWHHVVVVIDSGTCAIYKDGVAGTGGTYTVGGGFAAPSVSLYFQDTGNFTTMSYDEVRIYNRALSASEVAYLYNSGAARVIASSKTLTQGTTLGPSNGLVGHWSFDGGDLRWTSQTAGVAYDGSGNGNHGTLTNMSLSSAPVKGKLGQAFNFDGTDDLVSVPDPASGALDFGTGDFTVTGWIKANNLGVSDEEFGIVDKTDDQTNSPGWLVELSTYGGSATTFSFVFAITNGSVWNENNIETSPPGLFTVGRWYHFVMTRSGTTGTIYVDGSLVTSESDAAIDDTVSNSEPLQIGHQISNAGTVYFPGVIDDLRIYNRALTAAEVKRLYQLGTTIIR